MSRYTLEKVNDGPDFTKLVYNLIFDASGATLPFNSNNTKTVSGVIAGKAGQKPNIALFIVASNRLIDISELEPTSSGAQVSGVSLMSVVGSSESSSNLPVSFSLVDNQGNDLFQFPLRTDINICFPSPQVKSNAVPNANGDVYFVPIISEDNNENVTVQLTFKKHY